MANRYTASPDYDLIREVKKAGGNNLKKCYQCATCSVVCNLTPDEKPFPRKEMIMAQWGQTDRLMKDPDLWLCYQCNDCSVHCPREARPGDVLAAVRSYIYKNFAFPRFMGKALASPGALPILFLVPVAILMLMIFTTAPVADGEFLFMTSEVIDYNYFLPHSSVDALFVIGNILIFVVAAVGFYRFWRGLISGGPDPQIGFFPALSRALGEIFSHKNFFKCEANKSRSWGHIFLFAGFVGSMITTGLVFILIFIPHYLHEWQIANVHLLPMPPIEFPHPIKLLGAISGTLLVLGGVMLVYRRWTDKDKVGANGYTDYLFLYVIFFVGLTGMFSWLARSYFGIPMLAYVIYFIHMVFVFFLLWYMPYSKFAHMIYRTLALVYARSINRKAPESADVVQTG